MAAQMQIPSDVVREILLHLPAESLLRARAVCRDWCNIIDEKSFIDSHTITSQLSPTTLLIPVPTSALLYSISIDSLINCVDLDQDQQNLEATCVKEFSHCRMCPTTVFPLPSCHGLILLHSKSPADREILNPLTRKVHKVPQPPGPAGYSFAGIGYDYSSDDYKVVSIGGGGYKRGDSHHYSFVNYSMNSFVYSMKTDSWRQVEDVDIKDITCRRDGIFFNGFLHWKSSNYYLTRFDLATELYDKVPLPKIDGEVSYLGIGLLEGCLVVSLHYLKEKCLEGWVMKEERWMKLFSIENCIHFMRPVAYLKGRKGLVLLNMYYKLYLFDTEKNSLKMVNIQGLPGKISFIMCFSESLVSLYHSYDVTTKKSRVCLQGQLMQGEALPYDHEYAP